MPNNDDMLNDLDFESKIHRLNDRELSEFTARQVHEMCGLCRKHTADIKNLQDQDRKVNRKAVGAASGIGGTIGTAIGAAILFLIEKIR